MSSPSSSSFPSSSSSYVQLDVVFDVQDWDALLPLLREGYNKVRRGEPSTYAYLFAESEKGSDDDESRCLTVNEVYPDGQAVLDHLGNVGDVLGRALSGPCAVRHIYASGPAKELHLTKPLLDPLGPVTYFESIEDEEWDGDDKKEEIVSASHVVGIRDIAESKEGDDGDDETPVESFVILPVFKVHDWDKVKAEFIIPLCVAAANDEPGCVHYSFARSSSIANDESLLLVRERYANVEAALQHLEGAVPVLASCMSEGLLELVEAAVYGTSLAIEASRPALDPFGTQYRTVLHAFDRFQVA